MNHYSMEDIMDTVTVNGIRLAYESRGTGEPVLLISPVLCDGFVPLLAEPALAERYRLIRYHKRGWGGSTHTPGPVAVADHVADAVALLDHLGIDRVHAAGHSSGAAVAAQMAQDHPDRVATVSLLELSLLSVPAGEAFFAQAAPAFEAYAAGDAERAIGLFLSLVSGMDPEHCRTLLDERLPGGFALAVKDADTFFGIELPALAEWRFGPEHAAAIRQPVLSLLGSETRQLWVEVAEFLRSTVPDVEECVVDSVGHLLHIQRSRPVAKAMARFLARHPMAC
ncbi:alpha/beta fold hydrolase [Streptomyces sp. NBC_00091]|uniref:alpha/beta fold hydrolase n=1 Tax=Streptomyces sp. NBC_00091 TaxID=2975648 RepID=UPI00224E1A16|nr:alpha/beta hydrolase [Streptomyces sp. NBC_00091]MCX5381601.1 alpha/beta hydrolase [Streptomyces sp. NBC_00091]